MMDQRDHLYSLLMQAANILSPGTSPSSTSSVTSNIQNDLSSTVSNRFESADAAVPPGNRSQESKYGHNLIKKTSCIRIIFEI